MHDEWDNYNVSVVGRIAVVYLCDLVLGWLELCLWRALMSSLVYLLLHNVRWNARIRFGNGQNLASGFFLFSSR